MLTDIRDFLIEFKESIKDRGLHIIPRAKNNQTIRELGLTMSNIREIIFGLGVKDYSKGPELDRDKPGEVWVFGKQVDGKEIYIKLKLAIIEGVRTSKCISFHIADRPLRYKHSSYRELEFTND